ncbi:MULTISPECIES: hypothetical protein [Anaerotruncus]|nr:MULTISPECIES: hypothetical protein [Anaerotruncus]
MTENEKQGLKEVILEQVQSMNREELKQTLEFLSLLQKQKGNGMEVK